MARFSIHRIQMNKFILSLLVCLIAFKAYAESPGSSQDSLLNVKSKKEYLEMRGIIKTSKTSENGQEKLLDSAMVRIYSDTTKPALLNMLTDKKGKCDFKLPLGKKFYVLVSKSGYTTKMLEINTKVPSKKKFAYIFPFSVDLFETVDGVDFSILKKPIGKIAYYTNKEMFDYDYAYTNRVNADLKHIYKDYYIHMVEPDTTAPQKIKTPVPDKEKKPKNN